MSVGISTHVQAAGETTASSTSIKISPIPPQEISKDFAVTAVLTDGQGNPIGGKNIAFLVDGVYRGQARTNAQGQGILILRENLVAGGYTLTAVFQGTRDYSSSSATTRLIISPYVLSIQTIPPVPGIRFKLGDEIFVSGVDGVARLGVDRAGTYQLLVIPGPGPDDNTRVDFNRWNDDVFVPYRTIKIPTEETLQAGFMVSYRQGQAWVDLENRPVARSRITSIALRNTTGTTYYFADGEPRWLPAISIARFSVGLVASPIQYGIVSVMVDGSNVVTAMQQRFFPQPGGTWPVKLLLFTAEVKAKDALLGTPVGKGVTVEYPDGRVIDYQFDTNDTLVLSGLARGIYYVQVQGVQGIVPRTPIALSQNQVLNMTIVTRLDIFLGVFFVTLLALSLLFIGRPVKTLRKLGRGATRRLLPNNVPVLSRMNEHD